METDSYRIDADTYLDHRLSVPLDRSGRIPGSITLFAREIVRDPKTPRLVFFQGGPGSSAPRPAPVAGWIDWALGHYRVVLIDQRGTGASHPLDAAVITERGDAEAQADFLTCFRADSIIDDAEDLRRELQGDEPWHVLGQSYGGFINTAYLSRSPQGLASVMITAGLPSVTRHAIETYRLTWPLTEKRNADMYRTFPGLAERVWDVAVHLEEHEETLPTGERLSPARMRMLGLILGYSYGPQSLHFLFEDPFVTVGGTKRLSSRFLLDAAQRLSFGGNPLYGILHESIYAGTVPGATDWAAHRARSEFPQFALPGTDESPYATEREAREAGADFLFSGEHVFPWQMREDPALEPLADAADIIATRTFEPLYDVDALAENTVPASGWVYWDDMFVPASLSLETAEQIRGFEAIITNDYHHDGLRADGAKLLERMHTLNSRRLT